MHKKRRSLILLLITLGQYEKWPAPAGQISSSPLIYGSELSQSHFFINVTPSEDGRNSYESVSTLLLLLFFKSIIDVERTSKTAKTIQISL